MATVTGEAKAGLNAFKSHWVFFLVVVLFLVGLAFKLDRDNQAKGGKGFLAWFGGLPVVGGFFVPKS